MSEDKKTKEERTIGQVAKAALLAGKSNDEALAAVKEAFPGAKTTIASITWYRKQLRDEGADVMTAREMKRRGKA